MHRLHSLIRNKGKITAWRILQGLIGLFSSLPGKRASDTVDCQRQQAEHGTEDAGH
jgi:hypothetical protein